MASTYENDLRLQEIGTGEQSGTWGTTTNTNLELIGEALSYSATGEAIANASTHTITVADGVADEARCFYLKCTGGGQACTVTLAPNSLSKVWVIENTTSYTLTFTQGSGANVAILAGQVKMIATDGAGSGAAIYDLMQDLAVPDLFVDDDVSLQSDGAIINFGVNAEIQLTHVHDTGLLLTETGGGAPTLQFRDSAISISSSADATLDLAADGDINLTAGVDINIPANVGLTFGNDAEKIEGDGTDLTIAGNNINLTAVADVNIPSGVGLTFATAEKIESDGTDLSITVGSGGDINIPADIGLTFGDDGEKIEGDGTDLTITGNNINLTATADVVIPANVGITFGTGEKIEGDSTDLTVTSGADINLTATADINVPSGVGLTFGDDGEKIEGNGTDLTINSSNDLHLTATTDINIPANVGLTFGDDGEKIEGDGTNLAINSSGDVNITATTVDLDGNLEVSGTAAMTGVVTANAGVVVDNITIDGTEIDLSSGDLTIDVAGNIDLDADGGQVSISDGGTEIGYLYNSSSDFIIQSAVSDKDIKIQGNDGGSTVTALTLDMSDAGTALFNSDVRLNDAKVLRLGNDQDFRISYDSHGIIQNVTADSDILFKGNDSDGGGTITALTLDMSAAGAATFSGSVTANADVNVGANFDVTGNAVIDGTALVTGVLTTTAAAVFNGGFTSNGDTVTFTSANSTDPVLILKNTTNDGTSSRLHFVKDGGRNGANGDDLAEIDFIGDDAGQNQTTFGRIEALIASAADGSEGGKIRMRVATHDGEMQTGFEIIDGSAEDEIDVNIGNGTSSVTTIAGTLTSTGAVTANAGVVVDNITIDGNEIDVSSGDLTLDVAGSIVFDADSGDVNFKDNGVETLRYSSSASGPQFFSPVSDKDIIFKGNDNGSTITALTLDMSDAGTALFNNDVDIPGNLYTSAGIVHKGDTNTSLDFGTDQQTFYVGGVRALDLSTSGVVFNEGSADLDFRIETNAQASAFVLDAANDTLTITNVPTEITHSGNGYQLRLTSTDADASVGPVLDLYRNSANPADGDRIGSITYRGRNDNSQDVDYIVYDSFITDASDGVESAELDIRTMVAGTETTRILLDPAETVFNEASADLDFRVESNGNANMLFVDGGNDQVSIGGAVSETTDTLQVTNAGSSGPTNTRFVNTNDDASGVRLDFMKNTGNAADDDGVVQLNFLGKDSSGNAENYANINVYMKDVTSGTEDGSLVISTIVAGTNRNRLDFLPTETVFNEAGISMNFRVETDNSSNTLFVDGGNDRVYVGDNQGSDLFYITGKADSTAMGIKIGTNGYNAIEFDNATGSLVGRITTSSASTAYVTSSDYRLKENVADMTGATARLKQLKPKRFNWISDDTNTPLDGFLAHEVSSVVPEAVAGEKDAVHPDGHHEAGQIDPQGIDHSKLVPLLVKTIQELEARITTLEG